MYRHPKDVIVSQYNFQRLLMEGESGRPVPHTPERFAKFFDVFITGKGKYLIDVRLITLKQLFMLVKIFRPGLIK